MSNTIVQEIQAIEIEIKALRAGIKALDEVWANSASQCLINDDQETGLSTVRRTVFSRIEFLNTKRFNLMVDEVINWKPACEQEYAEISKEGRFRFAVGESSGLLLLKSEDL